MTYILHVRTGSGAWFILNLFELPGWCCLPFKGKKKKKNTKAEKHNHFLNSSCCSLSYTIREEIPAVCLSCFELKHLIFCICTTTTAVLQPLEGGQSAQEQLMGKFWCFVRERGLLSWQLWRKDNYHSQTVTYRRLVGDLQLQTSGSVLELAIIPYMRCPVRL